MILHVIFKFVSDLLQLEVYPRRLNLQIMHPLEKVISGILLHLLSFSPISLNNIFHCVICLVNTDSIFTLNNFKVEEI